MKNIIWDIAHLAHVELLTPKLDESTRFFTEIMGMYITETQGDSVYLRAYDDYEHHTLKLTAHKYAGIGHYAWRLRTADFQVAAELADDTNHNWEGWPPALLGLFLVALFILGRRWLFNNEENNPITYLMTLGTALGIAITGSAVYFVAAAQPDARAKSETDDPPA